MKTIIATFLLAGIFIIGGTVVAFSQNPDQLYQKGLIKEEGEGDLPAAIKYYKQVANSQAVNKSLRAKALLHVGLCYEKLGKEEATRAYQRLVNNYPGQKNEVAIAREHIK